MQVEKQRVRVIPDELETYRGVTAPIRKAVADKSEDAPVEIPKVRHRCQCSFSGWESCRPGSATERHIAFAQDRCHAL